MLDIVKYGGREFGDEKRFKIGVLNREKFIQSYFEDTGRMPMRFDGDERDVVFVYDSHQKDEFDLDEVVFQGYADEIESFEQIVGIVRRRFPESFVTLQSYLDGSLKIFQQQFGDGKFPTQDLVDTWIRQFYFYN